MKIASASRDRGRDTRTPFLGVRALCHGLCHGLSGRKLRNVHFGAKKIPGPYGGATRQSQLQGGIRPWADSRQRLLRAGKNQPGGAESGQSQLESWNVTIKSHLTYVNLTEWGRLSL